MRAIYSISMRSSCWPLRPRHRLPFRAALVGAVVWLVAYVTPASADQLIQGAPAQPDTGLSSAERALRAGDYDAVAARLGADASSPAGVVVAARAASARGRYDDAVRVLTPAAEAAPAGDAAAELGTLLLTLGRRADAERWLTGVLRANADAEDDASLARAAEAARALGRFQQSNDLFRDAVVMGGFDPAVQTAWGELLLDKHNAADAGRSFRQALQIDRTFAPALLGLARVIADTNPPAAADLTGRALRQNPSYVPALVFRAELALDDEDAEHARSALDRALAVNPASLDALSLEAALAYLDGQTAAYDDAVRRALAVNPQFGTIYRVVGEHAARHYRFEEAVALTRRALALDPADPRSNAALGMHLLRTGDEAGARAALDRAFSDDPYDVVTYNLLGLLDTLDKFVTIEDGPILLRLNPEEAPVLREHAVPLARDALRTLAARYGVTPEAPVLVEIFPRHDDFAVRTLGLPGMIGALGACFGRVVTLDSPHARPPGTFSWEATLWHEMAHVVTLQLSKQRVPRWLTEGISVYEEERARAEWGRDMQVSFAETMDRDEVIPLAELNRAFGDPDRIALAYYEASLVVGHIVDRFGMERLKGMLQAYGEGLDTDAAVRRGLGVELPDLQASFTRAITAKFARIRAALAPPPDNELATAVDEPTLQALAKKYPESYPVWLALAHVQEDAGEKEAALASFERAAARLPEATGPDAPRAHIAALALELGDRARAASTLEALLAFDHTNVEAARQLLTVLDADVEPARVLQAHARIAELDPFDAASQSALGRAALERGDAEGASRWFRAAIAGGPRDKVGAYCDLAEAYWQLGRRTDAKRQTLAALELAPSYARAQDLLLSIVEGRP